MIGNSGDESDWARLLQAAPVHTASEYSLKGAYRLLFALLIVALAAALFWPDNPMVDRFAPNAATEMFGIIVTLAFVHRLLYRQERARRMRASIGAYRRANWALARLIRIWADVVKGCYTGKELPRSLPRLFAAHTIDCIALIDPQRRVSPDEPETWALRLKHDIETVMADLNGIILSYGGVVDPAYAEGIDELIDHPFVKLIVDLGHENTDAKQWHGRMRVQRGHIEDFFYHLLLTIALHNSLAAEAATVRSRGRAPRSGTLGMELARDHDLRIETELEPAWVRAGPAQGTLRA